MTKYIKFDEKGRQIAFADLDGECPEGHMPLNTDEIDGKLFYLENNIIKSMPRTQENFDSLWAEDLNKQALDFIRSDRDQLLTQSDWIEFPSAPISEEKRTEWRNYRQALRDFPSTIENPRDGNSYTWPTPPSK
jgi:hypothetical protein